MSHASWVIADPHFGHQGMCNFRSDDGSKIRPWDTAEEMDEALVANWNSVVRPQDRVYLLGDVAMKRAALPILGRLTGRKVLVKGNHDIFVLKDYLPYFDDIRACVVRKRSILTHIPIHESSVGRFKLNIHGHMHEKSLPDPRYVCVSVEQINYTPINLDIVEQTKEHNHVELR
jgi:calcineurin-like phosphoesterase family protein